MTYGYNSIGQVTTQTDLSAGVPTMKIVYSALGVVKQVTDASDYPLVAYEYDDKDDRSKKTTYNTSHAMVKTDYYVRDASGRVMAVYEQTPNSTLKLTEAPIYGAGRIGMYKPASGTFYEINDHLGNVRSVIGQPRTDTYLATMETEVAGNEDKQFANIAPRWTYVNANNTPGGNEAIRINNGQTNGGYAGRIAGAAISLKVAPGDVISAEVYGYYDGGTGYNATLPLATIASAVAGAFGPGGGVAGDPGKLLGGLNNTYTGGGFAGAAGSGNPAVPAAYLNLVMFDQNILTDPTTLPMAATPLTSLANGAKQKITIGPITIPTAGFVYIYVNQNSDSPNWVYFDDLKVTHLHSPYVAGADFYPFGLPMKDREISVEPYRYGYQGQYSEKDSLSKWNEFQSRMYDARFGRWLSPDPAGQFSSPYIGMGNVPTLATDPDGRWSLVGSAIGTIAGIGASYAANDQEHWYRWAAGGFIVGGIIGEVAHSDETRWANGWDRFTAKFGEGKVAGGGHVYDRRPRSTKDPFNVDREFGDYFKKYYVDPITKYIEDNAPDDIDRVMNSIRSNAKKNTILRDKNTGHKIQYIGALLDMQEVWGGNAGGGKDQRLDYHPINGKKKIYYNPGHRRFVPRAVNSYQMWWQPEQSTYWTIGVMFQRIR
jgi:RHS repeat-associated protein